MSRDYIKKGMSNDIYTPVDESFLMMFSEVQKRILENAYYAFYLDICEEYYQKKKPLSKEVFFTNMKRRRIRLYQLCCPYCGKVELMFSDNRDLHTGGFNYCPHCGKGSVEKIIFEQLARLIRISAIVNTSAVQFKEQRPDGDIRFLAYDGYQMEIVLLSSIIEAIFRDFFDALFHMSYYSANAEYVKKMKNNYTKNDFMNIEKANDHYKKAFDIDIKSLLTEKVWNDLIDINALRNMMIHNNGYIDAPFQKTKTYERLKDKITNKLILLDSKIISRYIKSVIRSTDLISEQFRKKYNEMKRSMIILNYVFTKS